MALTTATITGRVPMPDDSAAAAAEIIFRLSGYDTEGSQVIPPQSAVRYTLASDGSLPVGAKLWKNTSGLRGTAYRVTVLWTERQGRDVVRREQDLDWIQVGTASSYTIAALLANPAMPTPGWYETVPVLAWQAILDATSNLKPVATSGAYSDLTSKPSLGSLAAKSSVETPDVADAAMTNAKLASMPEARIKGRAAGAGIGAPVDLTAAQAREAMGMGVFVSAVTLATDFNSITASGIYRGYSATGAPEAEIHYLITHTEASNGRAVQYATSTHLLVATSAPRVWVRYRADPNGWSAWLRLGAGGGGGLPDDMAADYYARTGAQTAALSSGALSVNALSGHAVQVAMTADIASVAVSNWPTGVGQIRFFLAQDATGGRTVTWPAGWRSEAGAPQPQPAPGAGLITEIVATSLNGGTLIRLSVGGVWNG